MTATEHLWLTAPHESRTETERSQQQETPESREEQARVG